MVVLRVRLPFNPFLFIRPFEKRTYYAVDMVIRPSVSRASEMFSKPFSTCFEIWTWNLVYTFGRWHDTSGFSFITTRSLPLESFPDFFLSDLRYQLGSCFIHSVCCTTYRVHVSPEWGPCDLFHVLRIRAVNQHIHRCWQTGVLGSLRLFLFILMQTSNNMAHI